MRSECNLEWKAFPSDRSKRVADCPYWSGKKAIPEKTSFKAQNPSLMTEWKDVNNLFIDADSILEITVEMSGGFVQNTIAHTK